MRFIGVDPGLGGALAVIDPAEQRVGIHDTPVMMIQKGTGKRQTKRREYDIPGMRAALLEAAGDGAVAAIEALTPSPKFGTLTNFGLGRGVGLWEGLLVGLEIPYETVKPRRWKAAVGIATGANKSESRRVAGLMFPAEAHLFKRKSDDGRAEALLIAETLRRLRAGAGP